LLYFLDVKVEDLEEEKKFFCAKAWALLHDPPHKMWVLGGTLSLTGRGHKEEALEVWKRLGLREAFGDPSESEDIVQQADDMASTSDRWITNFVFAKARSFFEYKKLHNIFNPRHSIEISRLERGELENFLNGLAEKLKPFTADPRRAYHALYTLYEVEWARQGLPPSLADTRAPTHTLFDHVYATTLALNLLWPDRRVGGYAVMIDIPSIQQIVGAARKTGDFWVGSWMISTVTWLTLWPFVWEFGADVLLKPSPRYNPYYHATLSAQLGGSTQLWKSFAGLYSLLYLSLIDLPAEKLKEPEEVFKPEHMVRQPLIPGTACLVLPKARPNGQKLGIDLIEKEVKRSFEKAYDFLLALASGEEVTSEEPYAAFFKLFRVERLRELRESAVVKLFKIVEGEEPQAFEELLRPRIAVVDVSHLYKEWLKVVKGEAEATGGARDILKDLAMARTELAKRLEVNEEKIAERLTWQAFFALLYAELNSKAARRLVTPKAWFLLKNHTFEPLAEFERFYDSGKGVGYITCSTCGNEPAVLRLSKLSKIVERATITDYSERARRMLEDLKFTDKEIEELKVSVKPGESLGPLCLTKRALYSSMKRALELELESTEDVALNFVIGRLRGLVKAQEKQLEELGDEGRRVKSYIMEEVKSYEKTLNQNADIARALYERVFRELAERSPGAGKDIENHTKFLSKALSQIYRIGDFDVLPESFLTSFRSYYCILRADADNVRKLAQGEVPVSSYLELLEDLRKEAEERGEVEVANAFGKAKEIVEVLFNKPKKVNKRELLIPSPTYALALSTALMVTALKSTIIVEHELKGLPVFSGGDDDLALLPVETGLAAVEKLRAIYHGEEGFHKIGNYVVPAPAVYGKSFSLRFVGILDLMADEIAECAKLLEETAKKAVWTCNGDKLEKDTLVLSESRGGSVALLPLSDRRRSLKALEAMWVAHLCGVLSANLPEDYERVEEIVETALRARKWDLAFEILQRTLERNACYDKSKSPLFKRLLQFVSELKQPALGEALIPYEEEPEKKTERSVLSWLIEAFRVMRGYP
jgi:CRISPR-associated protein Cmr2